MSISTYSIVMGIVWFSVTALIGSFLLRKTSKGGLLLIATIFVLALLRMFVPLDFDNSIVIRSEDWYPFLQNIFTRPLLGQVTFGTAMLSIWLIGAVIGVALLTGKLIRMYKSRKGVSLEQSSSKFLALAQEVSKELNYSGEIDLLLSVKASTAYQAGFIRPFILLPTRIDAFSDEEIRSMLRHELCHFLGNDLWIKTGIQFVHCILWWNPVMGLLSKSVEHILELRCDQRACKGLTQEAQFAYLQTLMHLVEVNSQKSSSIPMGYIGNSEDHNIIQRFKLIMEGNTRTLPSKKVICGILACIILFVASYAIILQPWIMPLVATEETAGSFTQNTTYIVHTAGDQYNLYVDGTFVGSLYEEQLKVEPICNYTIYEGGFPNEKTQQPDS